MSNEKFYLDDTLHSPVDLHDLLDPEWELVKDNKKIEYYNIPASFDIETTSFYDSSGNKCSIMYCWQLGINGHVIFGRTWEMFLECYQMIVKVLGLNENKRLIIYCHNLGMEFQYLQFRLKWLDVFALAPRTPAKAVTEEYVEFRCSYILSGYKLEKVGEMLVKYPVKKLVGDLDYSLLRHTETPMTDQEKEYCKNDVLVVMAYIQERIEADGNITKIPLTNTGYVRREVKHRCLYGEKGKDNKQWHYIAYHKLMKALTLEKEELEELMEAFQGGFTHASCMYSGKIMHDVGSIDFTSSYPYVLLSEQFPMSKGQLYEPKDAEDMRKQLILYCCLFEVTFHNLCATNFVDHPISSSRCRHVAGMQVDNGRVVRASELTTTVTELDFWVYQKFYTWDKCEIRNFRRYRKGYLPTDLVKSILKFYKDKTVLKDVLGKEVEYLHGKGMLNSTYGMMVTSIIRPEIIFEDGWKDPIEPDIEEQLTNYNEAMARFLYYPWGIWCTAYARRNLFMGIIEMDSDYLYADTDSLKCINMKSHKPWIDKYNQMVEFKLRKAMAYHKIDFEECQPMTVKGEKKLIGVWDNEGNEDYIAYSDFKALRAKAYMYKYAEGTKHAGEWSLTVSGINKSVAMPFILEQTENPLEYFSDTMYVPPEATGKLTHTYIDEPMDGIMTDYLGNTAEYHELSAVHLEASDYTLSLTDEYIDFLLGIGEEDNY